VFFIAYEELQNVDQHCIGRDQNTILMLVHSWAFTGLASEFTLLSKLALLGKLALLVNWPCWVNTGPAG